jgi:very-short-patch-repair endonuclease
MKKRLPTLEDLKKSACASLNQHLFQDVRNLGKKKSPQLPGQMCQQAQWMWGQLAAWSLATGIQVVKEHKFHPIRKWRFDFAVPDKMIGIEYDGLQSAKSRHTTLTGFSGDTEKMNEAQALGWKVIRFTVKNYKTVMKELEKQLQ